jgi:hypothetical protein
MVILHEYLTGGWLMLLVNKLRQFFVVDIDAASSAILLIRKAQRNRRLNISNDILSNLISAVVLYTKDSTYTNLILSCVSAQLRFFTDKNISTNESSVFIEDRLMLSVVSRPDLYEHCTAVSFETMSPDVIQIFLAETMKRSINFHQKMRVYLLYYLLDVYNSFGTNKSSYDHPILLNYNKIARDNYVHLWHPINVRSDDFDYQTTIDTVSSLVKSLKDFSLMIDRAREPRVFLTGDVVNIISEFENRKHE